MVKRAAKKDLDTLVNLAGIMWDRHSVIQLFHEFSEIMAKGDTQFFLKYEDEIAVGFAQCRLRHDHVKGTKTSPVGYLERVFVKEGYRNKGYAVELLEACEAWAKENGCMELAGDCEIDDKESFVFYTAMNITEANRLICFTKAL